MNFYKKAMVELVTFFYITSEYMTKKLGTFSHALRTSEKEGKWLIFRAKPEKLNHISPFLRAKRAKNKLMPFLSCTETLLIK